ncbi:hypothetical protein PSP31121_05446 [Pandoraea sputorum]|uniref:Uncharacterized protein n=1 Tax=Pandoraea sputorum TaxID=93222 RepID=A0A5E5BL86_9BURK|nr:hypothetical protein PSP31121_05446 [Pandoraea sputorum]
MLAKLLGQFRQEPIDAQYLDARVSSFKFPKYAL